MATAAEAARSRMTDVLRTVNERLPGWRRHVPRRTLAADWGTRTVEAHGHEFFLFSLPGVGVSWFRRGPVYWMRRVGLVVLLAIAVAVIVSFDVGFAVAAASTSTASLGWLIAVLVVLFAAASLFYWRSDLFVRKGVAGTRPLPGPVKVVGIALAFAGLVVTPGWLLAVLLDQLLRFPVQERAAWDFLASQQPDDWGRLATP